MEENENQIIKPEYKYSALTGKIIGCAMEVHSILRSGFQERIYQKALAYEFELQGLKYERELHMDIFYKKRLMGARRVDFLVEKIISVELKALIKTEPVHLAQAINYLEAYNLEVGLLINFGNMRLEYHRLANKKFQPLISISSKK